MNLDSSETGRDFAVELDKYDELLPRLLADHEGEYVAIVGDEVFGPFAAPGDAWRAGFERQRDGAVFVRQVASGPRVVSMPVLIK
ncbi:MAG: hypothetical protein ABMB14_20425 [Myxococcota bacterium]